MPMDPLQELLAERDCRALIMGYAQAVNEADLDSFVELFAPDGRWQRPGQPALIGRPAIRAFMAARPTNRVLRHVSGGARIRIEDEDHAYAISQTLVYECIEADNLPAPMTGPHMIVEYRDWFERTDDGWRIAQRDTLIVFRQAATPQPNTDD